MKILYSIALLLFAFLISCSTTKPLVNPISEEIDQSNITSGEVSLNLYSKDKSDTVESSIDYMFYTDPILPYQDSINRIIKMYISGVVSNGGGATEQDSHLTEQYIEEAINKFGDEYKREMSLIDGGGVWSSETSIHIIEGKSDYVEVSFYNWNFSGGAHGNSWSEQRIFDITTGSELKLMDFFTDYSELRSIAEEIFRADQEIPANQSLEAAGFWFDADVFSLNDNFVFNEESLDFLYNQYEIAPYSAGMIFISIPIDKIKHLLKRKVD